MTRDFSGSEIARYDEEDPGQLPRDEALAAFKEEKGVRPRDKIINVIFRDEAA